MSSPIEKKRILLVDQNINWLEFAAETLAAGGGCVLAFSRYDYRPDFACFDGLPPDLVILGCAKIRQPELDFIQNLKDTKQRTLVLCASLSWSARRSLFLAGVDVADKPYDADSLVRFIEEAFEYPISDLEEKFLVTSAAL